MSKIVDSDGETVVVATEADDAAALAMQMLKLLSGGQPAGINDLRYWKDDLYWYVNTNHPRTSFGDHLGALKALAEKLDIPCECYDHCTPDQLT